MDTATLTEVQHQAARRAAEIVAHSETYNRIVAQQRELSAGIDKAIAAITAALSVKEQLAKQQDDISTGDVSCPNAELSPRGIREALQRVVIQHLAEGAASTQLPKFGQLDWSCRSMNSGGSLLLPE